VAPLRTSAVLSVCAAALLLACDRPASAPPPAVPAPPASADCPAGMVFVPPVEDVTLGETDPGQLDACGCVGGVIRAAAYSVPGFCIDRFPFPGEGRPWPTLPPGGSFTWSEAEEVRARLPELGRRYCSYAEVLLASAGGGNRRYPWGDRYEDRCEPDQRTPARPIGGWSDCASPEGIRDLGVRTAWVTLDTRTAKTLTAALDAPTSPGRLVLSGAHSATEEAFFARSNYGIHSHTGGYGVFADEPPTGWEWIDDGLRFCADPAPPDAPAEARYVAVVDGFEGDLAALWAVPVRAPSGATSGPRRWAHVEAGWLHSCALDDRGEAVCWGFDRGGSTRPPTGPFIDLAVGRHHSCALRATGEPVCWGLDAHGQSSAPAGRFDRITAGEFHTCALGNAGAVCWGLGTDGQTAVPAGRGFNDVIAGGRFTCGVGGPGDILCWGSEQAPLPTAPLRSFDAISAGGTRVCGVHEGRLECWGEGEEAAIPSEDPLVSVSVGLGHTCGVTRSGRLVCGGANRWGQATAPPGSDWVQVTAGFTHSCALDSAGRVTCWGGDGVGQSTVPTD